MPEIKAAPEIKGYILETKGQRARIKVNKKESERKGLPNYLDCWNSIGAKKGEIVDVQLRELNNKKGMLIMYAIPILSLLAGIIFGNSVAIFFKMDNFYPMIGGGILWLFFGITYSNDFRKDVVKRGEQPVIIDIIYEMETLVEEQEKKDKVAGDLINKKPESIQTEDLEKTKNK